MISFLCFVVSSVFSLLYIGSFSSIIYRPLFLWYILFLVLWLRKNVLCENVFLNGQRSVLVTSCALIGCFGCFGIKFCRSGVVDILLFLKQITCRCLGMWIFFTYIKKTAKNSYYLHNCLRKQRIVCTFASSKG